MPDKEFQPLTQASAGAPKQDREVLHGIARALEGLRFGSVEITVHEGRVTFIERKEKLRLN